MNVQCNNVLNVLRIIVLKMLAALITNVIVLVVVIIITCTVTPFTEVGTTRGEKEMGTFRFGHVESEAPLRHTIKFSSRLLNRRSQRGRWNNADPRHVNLSVFSM